MTNNEQALREALKEILAIESGSVALTSRYEFAARIAKAALATPETYVHEPKLMKERPMEPALKGECLIGWDGSGWTVCIPNDKRFSWDHNDEDMGTGALKEMFEYLGYTVKIEEWY